MGFMQVPVGVVVFDTELRIVEVNEAAERLTGGPPATEWAGRRLGEVLPDIDADLIERSLRRGLATREAAPPVEGSSHHPRRPRRGPALEPTPAPHRRPPRRAPLPAPRGGGDH